MSTVGRARRLTARSAAIGAAGLLIAGLAAVAGPSLASASSGGGMQMAAQPTKNKVGTTVGWYNGHTVTFHYSRAYFCQQPPSSAAKSGCELGADYDGVPSADFDPLYVVVPLGFTPPKSTLACPTAGKCIDHPHTIDLSRIFGSGTENSLLPPHSHVITTLAGGKAEWWNVDVIGVKTMNAWTRIVAHKGYHFINGLRDAGNPNVTDNIPTNLFLYFSAS